MRLTGWHELHVAFDGPRVVIRLQSPDKNTSKLVVNIAPERKAPNNGQIGLSAFNCGGVAFDTIQLSPLRLETKPEARFSASLTLPSVWYALYS